MNDTPTTLSGGASGANLLDGLIVGFASSIILVPVVLIAVVSAASNSEVGTAEAAWLGGLSS